MNRTLRTFATLVFVAALLFGAAHAQRAGGVFNAAVTAAPPTLDAMATTAAATRQATWFTLESLVTYDRDFQVAPLLAESWSISNDGLTYTFPLRRGVQFHNGKEMTAEDVIASYERFVAVSPRTSAFNIVESLVAIDDYTVAFQLKAPSASFLDALAYPVAYLAVMPSEIISGKGIGELSLEDMIGTGPYRFAAFRPDEFVRLERFDDYHTVTGETSGLVGNKTPYFDTVNLILVPEVGARMAGLETGEYDFAQDLPFVEFERLANSREMEPVVLQPDRWTVLDFNYCDELTSNVYFRRAVQAALDMGAIGAAQSGGVEAFYRVQPSIFFTESPWYSEVGTEPYNTQDLEAARGFLEQAGYAGEEVIMLTNRNYDYMYRAILVAADQLERNLGLNVTVQVMDWPAQRAMWVDTPGWHIDVTGYLSQASFSPEAYASIYHTSANRKCHANATLDSLFAQAAAATTTEGRQATYDAIQTLFYEDVIAIKTVDLHALHGIRSDIEGYLPWYNVTSFWNMWRQE